MAVVLDHLIFPTTYVQPVQRLSPPLNFIVSAESVPAGLSAGALALYMGACILIAEYVRLLSWDHVRLAEPQSLRNRI